MSNINNWTSGERYEHRKTAENKLNEIKKSRKGKKFILIPHPTVINTFIEIEDGTSKNNK